MAIRDQLIHAGLSVQTLASIEDRQQDDLAIAGQRESQETAEALRPEDLGPVPDIGGHARLFRRGASHQHALVRDDVLRMNNRYGNRYVNRVLKAAQSAPRQIGQAELALGAPDDRYEREADRIATRLASEIGTSAACASDAEGSAGPQLAAAAEGAAPARSAAEADGTRGDGTRGDGRPLPGPLRQSMERAFGVDLDGVRVHSDTDATRLNDHLQSHAFTAGRHIFIASGAFSPQTARGRALLAHEAAHVVQQTGSAAERAQSGLSAAPPGVVQRLLKGTARMLRQEGGEPSAEEATPKGLLSFLGRGKSLYAQILDALEDYEEVEWNYEHGEARRKGSFYVNKLTHILKLIDQWFEAPDQPGAGASGAKAVTKRDRALRQVRDIVKREIDVVGRHGAPDTRFTRVRRRGYLVDPLEKTPGPRR